MPSKAARRPARLDRAPRRTRATAPAHSNPSCTGAFFLDLTSLIEQNPHKEKRDPNSRSTLHHSIGPGGTRIPPGTAVLASMLTTRPAGKTGHHSGRSSREQPATTLEPASRKHAQVSDSKNRLKPSFDRQTRSLCHRITRQTTFTRDILATQASRRTETGSTSTMQSCT